MHAVFRIATVLALFAVPAVSHAQLHCVLRDSEESCRKKIQDEANEAVIEKAGVKKEMTAAVAEGLAKVVTGAAQAGNANAATSVSDFFTTLKAAVDTGSTNVHDDDPTLGFEVARCLREEVPPAAETVVTDDSTRVQCQFRVQAGGAKLYDPIKKALPDAARDARSKEMEGGLGFGDSLTAGLFFNLAGPRWGRVPRFASEQLFEDIWTVTFAHTAASEAAAVAATNAYEALRDGADTLLRRRTKDPSATFSSTDPFQKIADINEAKGTALLTARESSLRAEFKSLVEMRQQLRANRYFDLVDLVNNQPQLNFGIEYTDRDVLAGPNEWRARLVYEVGMVNVNSVHDECGRAGVDAGARVACLNRYLDSRTVQKRLKGGDRFALSIEAVHRKKYAIALPTDGITIAEDSRKSLIGSLAYGFYSSFDDAGEAVSRFDLKANYENVSDDPKRQDRGVAVATYSQRVMGNMVLAISLVYATKSEFRGEVDKALSGRLGFNYKWGKLGTL